MRTKKERKILEDWEREPPLDWRNVTIFLATLAIFATGCAVFMYHLLVR